MLWYDFGPETPHWKETRKQLLADRIAALVLSKEAEWGLKFDGRAPYVEVDAYFPGVRIRNLWAIDPDQWEQLTDQADEVYREVMEVPPTDGGSTSLEEEHD